MCKGVNIIVTYALKHTDYVDKYFDTTCNGTDTFLIYIYLITVAWILLPVS